MIDFLYYMYMLPFWTFKYFFPIVVWITVFGIAGFYIDQWWRNR